MRSIVVIGGGYVGLVTAVCLSEKGYDVTILENNIEMASELMKGNITIFEPNLDELFLKHINKSLNVTTDSSVISHTDSSIICVGTPPQADNSVDLSYVISAISAVKQKAKSNHICILRSTVPPLTYEKHLKEIVGNLSFYFWPEFIRQGKALADWLKPDRVVYGTTHECEELDQWLKELFPESPIYSMDITEAETVKLVSNAYLATRISFFNTVGEICKGIGANYENVRLGVGSDSRIGIEYMEPGIGYGGSCLPKDTDYLINLAKEVGANPTIMEASRSINEYLIGSMINLLESKIGNLEGKKISVLGLSFNPNTDDLRNSRSVEIIKEIVKKGGIVSGYDSICEEKARKFFSGTKSVMITDSIDSCLADSDACLVLNSSSEFSRLEDSMFCVMKNNVVIEGRRILNITNKEGFLW
jgi:nucleotide sugar dehydrogenase